MSLDESGFQLAPSARRTYAPRGKTPLVEAWHRKGRISAISAVTVSPIRRRPNLYFRLLADNTNAPGEDTVASLAQLRGEIKGPMTILWDQGRIHERSGVVERHSVRPDRPGGPLVSEMRADDEGGGGAGAERAMGGHLVPGVPAPSPAQRGKVGMGAEDRRGGENDDSSF